MTLFSSLNTALTGLQATMAALQTTGHNIANANTPGFSRQRIELGPQRPQDLPRFQVGRGVNLLGVRRIVDQAVETRLRDAASTLSSLGSRSETLDRVEALFGPLSGFDLGAQMNGLFASIHDLSLHPEDQSSRSQVLANAQTLAQSLNYFDARLREFRGQLNGEVRIAVDDLNRIASEIADLNREVVAAENGGLDSGAANDLRDRRGLLLRELSDLLQVTAVETSTGEVNVLAGSAFLVFGAEAFEVATTEAADNGVLVLTPVFADGMAPVSIRGGRLQGLIESRDGVLGEAARDVNVLANAVAFEFNRVQSSGQGLARFTDLVSLRSVDDPSAELALGGEATARSTRDTLVDSTLTVDPTGRTIQILSGDNVLETRRVTAFEASTGTIFLDRPLPHDPAIGDRYQVKELPFPVVNGGFDLVVTNESTGIQTSIRIDVNLDDGNLTTPDSSWSSVVAGLAAAHPDVTASLTSSNEIRIRSNVPGVTFSFANDTSGFLAAAGLNAFFSGSLASDIALNPELERRPELLSAALSNAEGDNGGALAFAALRDLASIQGAATFEDFYQSFVGELGVQAAEYQDRFESQAFVAQQLENQRERVSGVNLDEEAVHMIQYQRAFQASARFIGVIDELLNTLINGI
jgi:flagellar hook-associated protein FlgK